MTMNSLVVAAVLSLIILPSSSSDVGKASSAAETVCSLNSQESPKCLYDLVSNDKELLDDSQKDSEWI